MKVITTVSQWQRFKKHLNFESLGLVPTMGALHAGHLSLVEKSVEQNDATVVSLFVNPTQFNQSTDLESYPRDNEQDLAMLSDCAVDAVFMPAYETLYPDDFHYRLSESELSHQFCGEHRESHFDGVLTVVMKLFNIIKPDNAYFGEKDFQQLQLIRGMCEAFFMPLNIIACPVVREKDGLAMSSRNRRLDPDQRLKAKALYQCLLNCDGPEMAFRQLQEQGFDVDYVEDWNGRRLAAASLGTTRLIDNVLIE